MNNVSAHLRLVVLRAEDMERAAAFYRLLGLEFVRHRHGKGPEHYACEYGPAVFEIYPRRDGADSTASVRIGFGVASVDVAVEVLTEAGASLVSPPKDSPWGRRAAVKDLDGHTVELTEAQEADGA